MGGAPPTNDPSAASLTWLLERVDQCKEAEASEKASAQAANAAATAAENLLNGQQINFPSRPGAQQGSGVIPGQTFSGIQPRLGKNKDLSGEEGRASFGNNIEDDLSLAVENFPQDRIPVQFLGEIGIS